MISAEYLEVRKMAFGMNEYTPRNHPCSKGRAGCCTTMAPMVTEDGVIIVEAVREGQISLEVAKRAVERAQDPKQQECPFLADDRSCSIYPHRPISCAFWGIAGFPNTNSERMVDAVYRYLETGIDTRVGVEDVLPDTCELCSPELKVRRVEYSVAAVCKRVVVANYVQERSGTLDLTVVSSFVLTKLLKPPMSEHDAFLFVTKNSRANS